MSHQRAVRKNSTDAAEDDADNDFSKLLQPEEPSDDEIISRLATQAIATKEVKISIVNRFVSFRDGIGGLISKLEPNSPVMYAFNNDLPSTAITNKNKFSGAQIASKLLDIYLWLQDMLAEVNPRLTRDLFNLRKSLNETVEAAIIIARQEKMKETKALILKLSHQQLQRPYCFEGFAPDDIEFCKCIFCGHLYVDEPASNIANKAAMRLARQQHEDEVEEFKKKQAANQPYIGKKGKALTQPPRMAVVPPVFYQCHCHQMRCTQIRSERNSTCPIKCINRETGEHYGSKPGGGCACPICNCMCQMAWKPGAYHAVKLRKELDSGRMKEQELSNKKRSATKFSTMLCETVAETIKKLKGSGDEKMAEKVAHEVAKKVPLVLNSRDDPEFIEDAREDLGRPSTVAFLPIPVDGKNTVNTRFLGRNMVDHRKATNSLSESITNQDSVPCFPLRPYKAAYQVPMKSPKARKAEIPRVTPTPGVAMKKPAFSPLVDLVSSPGHPKTSNSPDTPSVKAMYTRVRARNLRNTEAIRALNVDTLEEEETDSIKDPLSIERHFRLERMNNEGLLDPIVRQVLTTKEEADSQEVMGVLDQFLFSKSEKK